MYREEERKKGGKEGKRERRGDIKVERERRRDKKRVKEMWLTKGKSE